MNNSFLLFSVKFLPFDILHSKSGFILSRGVHQLVLSGKNAEKLAGIIKKYQTAQAFSIADILFQLPKSIRFDALQLLFELYQRKFIVSPSKFLTESNESAEDLFYWHFETNPIDIRNTYASTPITIVGINNLSLKVYRSLFESGFQSIEFIDDLNFRSDNEIYKIVTAKIWTVDEWKKSILTPSCIIACGEAGGIHVLGDWNKYCVENKIPFYPVYLYQLMGYIGPWIWPGETACLECLIQRKNAKLGADEVGLQIESNEYIAKKNTAHIPSFLNLCAEHTVFEVGAHIGKLSYRKYNSQLAINLFSGTTTNNKILKQPRCNVCSTLQKQGAYSSFRRKI